MVDTRNAMAGIKNRNRKSLEIVKISRAKNSKKICSLSCY